ncbi:conserved hypothetical protein [Candidatus Desulfarcum epimagneticum]|uniref:Transcriptional regulator n=1 Tax=uncultured Desulfobacteraceae bacterium TaxID=218296 RepID=A0A484HMB1_9BACT|nr:conserved hypothetical protein [uncultured Desulfobacteraceae bacterium]
MVLEPPFLMTKIHRYNEANPMPELARFFGIIVCMYAEVGLPHHRPHFHVYYQNQSAVYAIDPIEMIGGALSRKQQRLVEAWAEIHQGELLENWERLQSGRLPVKVAPLR